MAEHGIIMRPESIRAYQAGRKTQTRRVVRWPLKSRSDGSKQRLFGEGDVEEINELLSKPQRHPLSKIMAPHGLVGDRLWFREAWAVSPGFDKYPPSILPQFHPYIYYFADQTWSNGTTQAETSQEAGRKRPSIFMPRWAARYTPPVTSLRIERLQDIDEGGAKSEGILEPSPVHSGWCDPALGRQGHWSYRKPFADLWDEINGKRAPWESNPWVWVYGFPRHEGTG